MALLMTMPAREMMPRKGMKPMYWPVTRRPKLTPMSERGIVSRMMAGLTSELNCHTSSITMINPTMGRFTTMDWLALVAVSLSPPSSQR